MPPIEPEVPLPATKARWTKAFVLKWLFVFVPLLVLILAVTLWPQRAQANWRSLSGHMRADLGNLTYEISPDSKLVAFVADKDTTNVRELYAMPITGTHPVKLNPPLVAGGFVYAASFTPDSKDLLYLAYQDVAKREDLYNVPVKGGPSVK